MNSTVSAKGAARIAALDHARTAAIVGMVIYHFGFDLEAFGRLAPATMTTGFWFWFARAVAGSFLFIAGLSLWLAHGRGVRWRPFLWRLAQIVAGATLVTVGTRYLLGPYYIFFGILHSIALSSVIGLAFLRLPPALTALAGIGAITAPMWARSDLFNAPWLRWTGLQTEATGAVDFVPTFPWLGPVLLGIAAAQFIPWARLRSGAAPSQLMRALAFPGRHGLAVYLIHQPVLIGILNGLAWFGLF